MNFDREIHEQYQKAYAKASSCQQKNKKNSKPVCPVSLDSMISEHMISYRQDLGILDVPTNLIVGAAEKNELVMLFTKEFLPVSLPASTMAEIWRQAYRDIKNENQSGVQVACMEYLGKFYVSEGLMQISVAKFLNIPTIRAHVIRVMPMKTDTREAEIYHDFLNAYRLTQLYQIQFTQQDFFEELQNAVGKNSDEQWTDQDRQAFLGLWQKVEQAFIKSYSDCLPITTADAFVVLLRRYTYRQLMRMDTWVLARVFQASWKELYSISATATIITVNQNIPHSLQTA